MTPKEFEDICKRLLREHGFENVFVAGSSHDGGIDGYGTLELNPFVSIKLLFQCKRYKGTVSRTQVGDFRNVMIGRSEKGIILTTGTFSEDAKREASRDGAPPIELIDGKKLIELFEAVQLGTALLNHYFIKMAFLNGWKSIVPTEKQEFIFNEIEIRMNDKAQADGFIRLNVPFAVIDCTKK